MVKHNLLMAVLASGLIFSLLTSCATVPTEPLTPGELRLSRLSVPGSQSIRTFTDYQVNIYFEADSHPEIKRICFYYSGDGPYCVRKWEISSGVITLWLRADRKGQHVLECQVEYVRDGKVHRTNSVATTVAFTQIQ